jgi:hypothetical protein
MAYVDGLAALGAVDAHFDVRVLRRTLSLGKVEQTEVFVLVVSVLVLLNGL